METPFDVLNAGLGTLHRRMNHGGTFENEGFEPTDEAIKIDEVMQEKFIFFNIAEEIDTVEISENKGHLTAGTGPELSACTTSSNPVWLYNKAMSCLALYRHLQAIKDAEEAAAIKARRPAPGVYRGKAHDYFVAIVTDDQRVLVYDTDGGLQDRTSTFDTLGHSGPLGWNLKRINTAEGTIEP